MHPVLHVGDFNGIDGSRSKGRDYASHHHQTLLQVCSAMPLIALSMQDRHMLHVLTRYSHCGSAVGLSVHTICL